MTMDGVVRCNDVQAKGREGTECRPLLIDSQAAILIICTNDKDMNTKNSTSNSSTRNTATTTPSDPDNDSNTDTNTNTNNTAGYQQ
jgi:hypothetical protein